MAGFYEGGFDVVDVDFIEHAFDQAFDGVFGCAVGAQARHTQGASRGAEDEVPPTALRSEVWQRQLYYMQRPQKIRTKLIPQIIVILVLARPDDTVARAVCDNINARKV